MDALFSPLTVQLVGAVIVAGVVLQVGVMLYSSWRRSTHMRQQHELSLDILRANVAAASAHSKVEHDRATLFWNGVRRFRIQRKVPESRNVSSFYLVAHDGKPLPPFQPGQYLTFQLKISGRQKPVVRCYSLSESPFQREYYRVTIKRLPPPPDKPDAPPGLSSSFFHDRLNEGDILDVKAPNGHFYLDLRKNTPVVLIGGGIGVTPVLSMLNAVCASGSKREVWFFYGVYHGGDHIMKGHLERLARENENVRLHVCYSDPLPEDVEGRDFQHRGFVSVELFKRLLPSNNYKFFLCGPPPMAESITNGLAEWGVPDRDVYFEAFGPATIKRTKRRLIGEYPAGEEGSAIEIVFAKSGKTLNWDPSAGSLLEFAENNGIVIDCGCRVGNCGTCVTAVKSGEVTYINEPGSSPEDGSCLTCISVPKTDLVLEA